MTVIYWEECKVQVKIKTLRLTFYDIVLFLVSQMNLDVGLTGDELDVHYLLKTVQCLKIVLSKGLGYGIILGSMMGKNASLYLFFT